MLIKEGAMAAAAAAAGRLGVSEGDTWVVLNLLGSVPFRAGDLSRAGAMNVEKKTREKKTSWHTHHSDRHQPPIGVDIYVDNSSDSDDQSICTVTVCLTSFSESVSITNLALDTRGWFQV